MNAIEAKNHKATMERLARNRQILQAIRDGRQTVSDIVKLFPNVHNKTISLAVKVLAAEGKIKCVKKWKRQGFWIAVDHKDGDELSVELLLMMGINPYPHNPGPPEIVNSQSSGGYGCKREHSYGVPDYSIYGVSGMSIGI